MRRPPANYSLQGAYRLMVLDRHGIVIRRDPTWHRNLILNAGMERVAVDSICNCFLYGVVGTGTLANSSSSGVTTAATSGATVTLTGGAFVFDTGSPGDVGNVIKWTGTGFEGRIIAVTDSTHATLSATPAVAQAGVFTLYRTNQTGCQTEVQRSSTYSDGTNHNRSVLSSPTLTHTRTWDFAIEVATVTYTELGVAWTTTLSEASTTFARAKLVTPLVLDAHERLRFQYQLTVTLAPVTSTAKAAVINNWTPTDGDESFQYVGLSSVATNGSTTQVDIGGVCNEPSGITDMSMFISPSSTALATFGAAPPDRSTDATEKTMSLVAYTALSFVRYKTATFGYDDGIRFDYRSMGVGSTAGGASSAVRTTLAFVFDVVQIKGVISRLDDMRWAYTWSRVLA